MEFFINESQLRIILQEQDRSKMTDYMKTLYSFTSDLASRVMKVYGINVKMLLTWGTSVGGLVMPLDNFVRNNNFDLTDNQRALVLIGVAFAVFFENKRGFTSILKKIKEEGLEDTFLAVLDKGKKLKDSFVGFLESCRITSGAVLDTVAYSFLIPIIADIYSLSAGTSNVNETALLIAERLIASGAVILSKELLSTGLKKIVRKFK